MDPSLYSPNLDVEASFQVTVYGEVAAAVPPIHADVGVAAVRALKTTKN